MSELTPQQLEELSEAVNNLTTVMNALPNSLANAMGSSNALGKAFVSASGAVDKYSQAQQKAEEERVRKNRVVEEAQYAASSALRNFSGALQDTSDNLKKYSNSVSSGFDALSSIAELSGSKFGYAMAGLTKILGFGSEQLLAYNSRLVNAYQSLSQFGIGAGITSEEIAKLGRESNFSGDQLQVFAKVTGQAGQDLIALGGTVTEGIRMFGRFTAVGDKVARQLNYLGVSTEQYLEYQQKFLSQEIKAGLATGRSEAAINKLTEASLELYSEMMKQAELTGRSVSTQIEERERLIKEVTNFQVYNAKKIEELRAQEATLGKETIEIRVAELRKQQNAILKAAEQISGTMGKQYGETFLRLASTEDVGALGAENIEVLRAMQMAGFDLMETVRDIKEAAAQGKNYSTQIQNMAFEVARSVVKVTGEYSALPTEQMRNINKIFGRTDELINTYTTRVLGEGQLEADARQNEYNRQRQIVEEGFKQRLKEAESISMASDAAMIFATTLYEKEREFRKAIDTGLATINTPFVSLAAVAVGAIAGIASLGVAAFMAAKMIRNAPWGQIPGTGPVGGPTGGGRGGKTPEDTIEKRTDRRGRDYYVDKETGQRVSKEAGEAAEKARQTRTRGPRIGKFGSPLAIASGLLVGYGADKVDEYGYNNFATILDILGTTAAGAGTGAAVGAPIAGVGALPGAIVGGAAGFTYGVTQAVKNPRTGKLEEEEVEPTDITEPTSPDKSEAAETPTKDFTDDMSDAELIAQTRLMTSLVETTGRSNKTAEESQQLLAAYMERVASAEEKAAFEKARENLAAANNKPTTGSEFTLDITREFVKNRNELRGATTEFTNEVAAATQRLIDFKSASLQATRNLRDMTGFSIFDKEETVESIKIDQSSIEALGRIIPRAYMPGAERTAAKSGPDLGYRPGFEDLPAEIDAYLRATRDAESGGGRQLRVTAFENATSVGGQYGLTQGARKEAYANLTKQELKRVEELGIKEAPTLDTLVMPDGKTFREGMEEVDNILAKSYARLTYSALKAKITDREVTAADMRGAWWHGLETYSRILDESIKNPDMLVSEFYRQQESQARAAGKNYVMPDPSQFKGRTLKQQLDYISMQVASVEQYKKELPERISTDVDPFAYKPSTDPFALENVGRNIRTYNERRNAELGITNVRDRLGMPATAQMGASVTTGTSMVVTNTKETPLITADPVTNINMTSLIDLNKLQTGELSSLNSKIAELNTKIDTLNDTQRKLLERTSA